MVQFSLILSNDSKKCVSRAQPPQESGKMTNEASLPKWRQEVRARLIVVGQKLRHHCREVIALQHVRVSKINGTVP